MRKMLYKLYMCVACLSYEHMIETGTQQPHNRNCDKHKQKQNIKKNGGSSGSGVGHTDDND